MGDKNRDQESNPNAQNKGHKRISPETKRRIAEVLILVGYYILDAFDIWPRSHSLGLFSAWFGTSAVLLAEIPFKVWLSVAVILAGVATAIFSYVGPATEPEREITGLLHPADDPPFGPTCNVSPQTPRIMIGGNFVETTLRGHFPLVARSGNAIVSADYTEAGLGINANIYGIDGDLIATIKNNSFDILAGKRAGYERPDASSVRVTDMDGNEMLFIRFGSPNFIFIRGVFAYPGKPTIFATNQFLMLPRGVALSGLCVIGQGFVDLDTIGGVSIGGPSVK